MLRELASCISIYIPTSLLVLYSMPPISVEVIGTSRAESQLASPHKAADFQTSPYVFWYSWRYFTVNHYLLAFELSLLLEQINDAAIGFLIPVAITTTQNFCYLHWYDQILSLIISCTNDNYKSIINYRHC